MPQEIEIDDIYPLLDAGAQLVEVLPTAEFEEEHLPGAFLGSRSHDHALPLEGKAT